VNTTEGVKVSLIQHLAIYVQLSDHCNLLVHLQTKICMHVFWPLNEKLQTNMFGSDPSLISRKCNNILLLGWSELVIFIIPIHLPVTAGTSVRF
jgi:hypothetical protein